MHCTFLSMCESLGLDIPQSLSQPANRLTSRPFVVNIPRMMMRFEVRFILILRFFLLLFCHSNQFFRVFAILIITSSFSELSSLWISVCVTSH